MIETKPGSVAGQPGKEPVMSKATTCPECGKKIRNAGLRCPYCGAKLKKNRKNLWIMIGVAVAIIAILKIVYFF
jgi:predicted amidophosphoribosyltransferase